MTRQLNGDGPQHVSNDVEALITRAWENYRVLSKAPVHLDSICEDVLSLSGKLRLVDEALRTIELSAVDRDALEDLKVGCNAVLSELETMLARGRAHKGTFQGVSAIQREVLEQENDLNGFLETLRSHSQERLLSILDQIREIKSGEYQRSIVTDWTVLEAELVRLGLPQNLIEEEFFFIQKWLKENYPMETPEEEALPDYTPGAQKGTIEEKVQALQQTDLVMRTAPIEPIATSSKADPPPYTFEDGADDSLDDTFSRYIDEAIRAEARIRAAQPVEETGGYPWSWLLPSLQQQYSKLPEVAPRMAAESFSVMAYETAPRCVAEIQRFRRLLRDSIEQKSMAQNGTTQEALRSLEVMSFAMHKFPLLQEQSPTMSRLSDLDALDYQCSTIIAVDPGMHFPSKEFELAQKGYYRLLTYVRGFMIAFASIYTGRAYITRSLDDIDFSWKSLKMDARVAWVEKQLAGWDTIQNAALYCREFHRLNIGLRSDAISILKDWQNAEKILSGNPEQILLRVIGAFSLPKSSFRLPTARVKIVVYGTNKFGGAYRRSELKTDVVQKSQDPVWNQSFTLDIPPDAKMVDLEVYDRVAGLSDKEISRVRLKFSSIPGVEPTFADKSLVYDYDEEVDYPLNIADGKGKEKEAPILRIGLQWTGRQAKVRELGLPIHPPGKMFRSQLGIPLASNQ